MNIDQDEDTKQGSKSAKLLEKIKVAVEAVNTVQAELVSRSKAVGLLLLEAKKLHPAVKDFEAFLKKVPGLGLSRAYDLLRLAGGRTTDEEIRKATRDRVKKHRISKKLPNPAATPESEPKLSVTSGNVTETAEEEGANAKISTKNLAEFQYACRAYLPKMNEADLERARVFFKMFSRTISAPHQREAA